MIATNPIVKALTEYKGSNKQSYLHENHRHNLNIFSSTLLLYENSIGGSSPCSAHYKKLQPHITHLLLASYTHPMATEPTTSLNTLHLQGGRCHLNYSLLADIKYLFTLCYFTLAL